MQRHLQRGGQQIWHLRPLTTLGFPEWQDVMLDGFGTSSSWKVCVWGLGGQDGTVLVTDVAQGMLLGLAEALPWFHLGPDAVPGPWALGVSA